MSFALRILKLWSNLLEKSNAFVTEFTAWIIYDLQVMQDEIARQSVCLMEIKKSVDNSREDSALVGMNELPQALTQLETKFLELNTLAEDLSHRFRTDIEAANEFKGKSD